METPGSAIFHIEYSLIRFIGQCTKNGYVARLVLVFRMGAATELHVATGIKKHESHTTAGGQGCSQPCRLSDPEL